MDRFIQFAIAAADEAVAQSGWAPQSEAEKHRTATVIGTGIGGFPALVHHRAGKRISAHTGKCVGAAALEGHDKLRGGAGFPFYIINIGQHLGDGGKACGDRLAGPALLLDRHGAEQLIFHHAIGFLEARDLEALAAQPDHEDAAHVGVRRIAPGGALQDVEDGAAVVDDAAIVHLEGDDAIDLAGQRGHGALGRVDHGQVGHVGLLVEVAEQADQADPHRPAAGLHRHDRRGHRVRERLPRAVGEAADQAAHGESVSAPARPTEWRTPPLWGIGLTKTVSGDTFFLHDGRARSLTEAILWHGGEAQGARDRFAAMTPAQRAELLAFLNSL